MMFPKPCFDFMRSRNVPIFTFESQMVGDSLQQQTQFIFGERLGDVVIGAFLHRLDCRLYGCETGHDDNHQIRTPLSQFE